MISELRPGPVLRAEGGVERRCYNHLLPQEFRGHLRLYVQHSPDYDLIQARVWKAETKIGYIDGFWYADDSVVPAAVNLERYRGRGVGRAMYEALYSHAYHVLGIRYVEGDHHSEAAHRVHKRLTALHRMPGYRSIPSRFSTSRWSPYRYRLT